ncbi:hypothetical protein [Kribbella sp. NPDC055071]
MSENDDTKSPFGPGFVAACIVVGAVLVCGILLLVGGSGDSDASGGTTSSSARVDPGASQGSAASPGSGMAQPSGASNPAEPVAGATTGSPAGSQAGSKGGAGCGPADGDQTVPAKAPAVDGWEVSRRVVVPRSTAFGPAKTDADGFRRCFAHSPTGALFAAYNAVAALADQRQTVATAQKLMLPGPNTDSLIRVLRAEPPTADSETVQLAGFRILDAGHDRATIMLATPVQTEYMSLTLTLVWYGDDWRVQSPTPGGAVGDPYTQHRDLSDFVAWSGV